MLGVKLSIPCVELLQRQQNNKLTALIFVPIHLGVDDRLLFNAPPMGLFFFFLVSLGKEEKNPRLFTLKSN